MNVISTHKLCKQYGLFNSSVKVLHDVDLEVHAGKLVGFLGPNGAGKTTTLRILLGLLKATTGKAEIFGMNCRDAGKAIRKNTGFLPGDVNLYSNMTGLGTLKHFARVRKQDCNSEIRRLSESLELPLGRRVRKYSTGMRQKLGLIQAFMHRPELLVLDEPTSALDPLIRTRVFEELRRVVDEGRTVLFSSHSLNEVEELCDEVIILRNGKIVEQQQIEVLRNRALRKVTVTFDSTRSIPDGLPDSLQLLSSDEASITCTWSGDINVLLDWVRAFPVHDLIIERPDLNDLFITYYSDDGPTHVDGKEADGA